MVRVDNNSGGLLSTRYIVSRSLPQSAVGDGVFFFITLFASIQPYPLADLLKRAIGTGRATEGYPLDTSCPCNKLEPTGRGGPPRPSRTNNVQGPYITGFRARLSVYQGLHYTDVVMEAGLCAGLEHRGTGRPLNRPCKKLELAGRGGPPRPPGTNNVQILM